VKTSPANFFGDAPIIFIVRKATDPPQGQGIINITRELTHLTGPKPTCLNASFNISGIPPDNIFL
jgi:hypothetical protein